MKGRDAISQLIFLPRTSAKILFPFSTKLLCTYPIAIGTDKEGEKTPLVTFPIDSPEKELKGAS